MEASALRRRPMLAPQGHRLLRALGDKRLVEQVRGGNAAAFEAIYDRHHAGILSFCRHLLGSRDEAEDALQATFASAYVALRRDDADIALKPWLYTLARNRSISLLRARREHPAELDEGLTEGLSAQVERRADLRALVADLAELPERQRSALVLAELGDLSHAQIADVVGSDTSQVKALVFQARSALLAARAARETPCEVVREELATARGADLRRGPLRRHVAGCSGCAAFGQEVRRQRSMLAVVLPVVPTLGLKESALAATGAAAGGAAGGAGGGMLTAVAAKAGIMKATAGVLAVAAGSGGALALSDRERGSKASGGPAAGAATVSPIRRPATVSGPRPAERSSRTRAPSGSQPERRAAARSGANEPARSPGPGVGVLQRGERRSGRGPGERAASPPAPGERGAVATRRGPKSDGPGPGERGGTRTKSEKRSLSSAQPMKGKRQDRDERSSSPGADRPGQEGRERSGFRSARSGRSSSSRDDVRPTSRPGRSGTPPGR